jgi:hypothetical protein
LDRSCAKVALRFLLGQTHPADKYIFFREPMMTTKAPCGNQI